MITDAAEKIHKDILALVSGGSTYIDALIQYSKDNSIEIETIGEIIKKSSVLKNKVKAEAAALRLLKDSSPSQEKTNTLESFFE